MGYAQLQQVPFRIHSNRVVGLGKPPPHGIFHAAHEPGMALRIGRHSSSLLHLFLANQPSASTKVCGWFPHSSSKSTVIPSQRKSGNPSFFLPLTLPKGTLATLWTSLCVLRVLC